MRVLLDCRSVFSGMGGIGRATACLARALPAALPEGELLLLLGSKRPARSLVCGPNVREIPTDAAMIDPLFEQIHLPALLSELNVDVYHGTCFATPIAPGRTRRVATVHDVVFRRHPELVEPGLRSYLDRWTEVSCELAEGIVTVSEFSRSEIAELYGRPVEQIHVIPNAVDEAFFQVERRRPPGAPYVLYVGAIEPKKNIGALLRGFATLLQEFPDTPHVLVLVGGQGGAPFDLDRALASEPSLRGRVKTLGHVPDDQLLELYGAADLFCYLSEYEGFGLPPLEAMAASVPCVVADRSSLPEVTGGAALLVDPNDRAAVATAMAQALRDPQVSARLAQRGRKVVAGYSWQQSAEALVDLYGSVMAQDPAQPLLTGSAL